MASRSSIRRGASRTPMPCSLRLPATAYGETFPDLARQLRSQAGRSSVSGALSLAPLWLAELAAASGAHPLMIASRHHGCHQPAPPTAAFP
jgi:hypothetical protein